MADEKDSDRLYLVKGAFIFYLSKYVAWPASRHTAPVTPFIFCVADNPEFSHNLNLAMQSRTIRGLRILVKTLNLDARDSESVPACDIMYFERTTESAKKMLLGISSLPVLTIGTSEDFLKAGGMIYLFERENKMHFSLNIEALAVSKLQLTADMFDLADSVVRYGKKPGVKKKGR